MNKRNLSINLIGNAVLAIKPYITKEDFDKIMREHDFAVDDPNGGLEALDIWDTPAMFSYEHTVRIVAEENDQIHLTDPIFEKLEEVKDRD